MITTTKQPTIEITWRQTATKPAESKPKDIGNKVAACALTPIVLLDCPVK